MGLENNIMTEQETPDTLFANSVYKSRSKENLVTYYHRVWWFPSKKTWIDVIKQNYFATWLGLTEELVSKYLPKSEHIVEGHFRQNPTNKGYTQMKIITHPHEDNVITPPKYEEQYNPK